MKKQQKKAFTLVELLVVIAILAILASVAVVGYTAFIKNAAVSNDENVVAQMNRYLEALQADSTGEWYGKEIHAGNVKQLTAYILDESGLEKLEPAAAKYGYNFYFDLEAGEYVAKRNEEVYVVTRNFFRGIYVSAEEGGATTSKYEKRLENCFTTNNQYFLVDTLSSLAELINSVYNIGTNEEGGAKEVGREEINALIESLSETEIYPFVSTSVIVTEGKNYRPAGPETPSTVIIVNNVTFINTHTQAKNNNGDWVDVDSVEKLADTDKLTLPNTVEAVENNALKLAENAEIYTEKTADELSEIANGSFTDANIKSEDGNTYKAGNDGITTTEGVKLCDYGYDYVLTKITLQDNDSVALNPTTANKNVVIPQENGDIAIKIPYEVNSFTICLSLKDEREEGSTAPVLGKDTIFWSIDETTESAVECKYSITNKTLTVTLKEDQSWPNNFTLTASSNNVVQSFVVDVEDITAGTVTFNGVDLVEGETPNMTVITSSSENITYAIAKVGDYTYTHGGLNVCDETIRVAYNGTGATVDGTNLVATSNGSGTLTITVGSEAHTYLTYTVNLTIADTSNFAIQPANKNITVVGNGNAVNVSELFMLKDGATIPAGAELVVYNGAVGEGDSYMNPDRRHLQTTAEGVVGVSVDKPKQELTNKNLDTLTLQFAGADANNAIRIAVMHNGVRISEDVVVKVVDGINVRTYADLTSNVNTTADKNGNYSYPLTNNVVFLNNITMSDDVNFLQIPADKTLYGNGFTFDIKKGRLQQEGIINLKGTLRDVMIVGKTYPTMSLSAGDNYGSSAVNANQSAEGKYARIINCYIANTRSPLRTSGNTIVEDTVLFGGRYSNIDMTGGTVTIRGTVTTVQQVYSADGVSNVIGIGVSAWFNDGKKNVVIEEGANFVQYNFLDSNDKQYLPEINIDLKGITYPVMDLKEPFAKIFENTDLYGDYIFTDNSNNKYVNSGIASTDKYMLDYDVTGNPTLDLKVYIQYSANSKKTVKVNTAVGDDELFVITYNADTFTVDVGTSVGTGRVQVTGKQLKAGVDFTFKSKTRYSLLDGGGDPTSFMFQVESDDYTTANVSGDGGIYNSLTYFFDKDLSALLGFAEGITSFHDRGIHYGKMSVGVNTFANTNTAYNQYLAQYIEMTDGDGEGDNFYTPENFQFVNGQVTNYWDN